MRRTAEDAAQTKQAILDAALKVFSEKGYHATRLVDIAQYAEVTRGAVYHHFGNKEGLYGELMATASGTGSQIVGGAIAQGGSIADVCHRILADTFSVLETNFQMRSIMSLWMFNTSEILKLETFNEQLRQQTVSVIDNLAIHMQTGIEQGALRDDLDPRVAARAFIAFQNGVIRLWLMNPDAFSIKDDAEALATVLMRGLIEK